MKEKKKKKKLTQLAGVTVMQGSWSCWSHGHHHKGGVVAMMVVVVMVVVSISCSGHFPATTILSAYPLSPSPSTA
jgi:hypothetical protein